ncbi:MAG: hypothetical protein PHQ34_07565 [Methanothrix sp.]|nr:hypothetical protein [Methanothrix sp.]
MNATNWTTWERYLPASSSGGSTGLAKLCLKPWDQILPEEGAIERMTATEPLWRPWEKYLAPDDASSSIGQSGAEMPERALV